MRDIEQFVYRHFQDVKNYGSPVTDLAVPCHRCDDGKFHLHVSLMKEAVHCFRCDYSASWISFVMDVTGYPYAKALGELYVPPKPDLSKLEGMFYKDGDRQIPIAYDLVILPEGFLPLAGNLPQSMTARKELRLAREYMKRRGFGKRYWVDYMLGIVPGKFRIYIPVHGDYYQARAIYPWMKPKYLAPSIPSSDIIFNSTALTVYDEIVITEGAFSAMAVGPNAVALLGKNLTKEKLKRLTELPGKRFIITVEDDAREAMMTVADALNARGFDVSLWKYSDGQDPADWVQPKESSWDFGEKLRNLFG